MNLVQQGQSKSLPARIGFWTLLLLTIFAIAPATYPGYWQALEGFIPIFNTLSPSPIANIATTADLWQGMGSGTFLLLRPLLALGLSPTAAVRIGFILCFLFGGLGIYSWLSARLGDYTAGLAGILYTFFPPFLATIYIRGALSDALVFGLFPLALAGIALYTERQSWSAAAIAVISLLWIWYTQAGLAVFVTCLLILYALFVERNRYAILLTVISGIAGLASTFPLLSYQVGTLEHFQEHFVYFFQLFGHQWEIAPSIPGWQDHYPFQIGFAAFGFSIVGVWLVIYNRHGKNDDNAAIFSRLFGFSFACILVLITLSLQISEPIWRWSGTDRLLRYPWQLIPLAGPFLAMTAGSLPRLNYDLRRTPYWFALVVLALLSSFPYLTTNFTQIEPPSTPIATFGPNHNFVILDTKLYEETTESHEMILEVTWQILQPLDFDYNVFFQAVRQNGQSMEVVAQLDTQPFNGKQPSTTWNMGEILTDSYRLDLSTLNLSGKDEMLELQYYFGYYDWRDGKRLPIDGGLDDKMIFYGQ